MRNHSTRLTSASARDSALVRLRRIERSAVVLGVALTAGFAVLAHAATPPYQKQRAAAVAAAAAPDRSASLARHRHQVRAARARHRAAARRAARARARVPQAVATPPSQQPSAAQAPVQVQPSPPAQVQQSAPPQVQPPPSPPAQTQQPPAATSGGS